MLSLYTERGHFIKKIIHKNRRWQTLDEIKGEI